jgi:hypothetical protein
MCAAFCGTLLPLSSAGRIHSGRGAGLSRTTGWGSPVGVNRIERPGPAQRLAQRPTVRVRAAGGQETPPPDDDEQPTKEPASTNAEPVSKWLGFGGTRSKIYKNLWRYTATDLVCWKASLTPRFGCVPSSRASVTGCVTSGRTSRHPRRRCVHAVVCARHSAPCVQQPCDPLRVVDVADR